MPTPFSRFLSSQLAAYLAILLGATFIGFSGLMFKASQVPPATGTMWRMLFALPIFCLWARLEKPQTPLNRKEWGLLTLCGLFFALDMVIFHASLSYTFVGKATLLGSLAPVFVVIMALFLGEKLKINVLLSLLLALLGAALMISNGKAIQFNQGQARGDVMALVASLFFATYIVFARVARLTISAGRMSLGWAAFCALFSLLFALQQGEEIMPKTLESWGWLIALGVLTQGLGHGLTSYALGRIGAGVGSIAMSFNAPIATLAAIFWIQEVPSLVQMIGGVIVIFALLLIRPKG